MREAEFQRIKNKLTDLGRRVEALPYRSAGVPNNGSMAMVGKVIDGGAMPSEPGRVYLVEPLSHARVVGGPAEGATPTYRWKTSRVPVVVFGTAPEVGDLLHAWFIDGNWVAEGDESIPPNPCASASNFIRLTLRGCNACAVPGATVDFIRNGILLHSAITNSSGIAQFDHPPPGAYTLNWSITAQGHLYSGSVNPAFVVVSSSCNSVSIIQNIAPPAPPGYTCYTAYPFPLPPLFVTDAAGTRPHGACVVHGGISVRTSIVPGGTCAAPTLTTGHEWVDGTGPSCNCTTLMTYGGSGCAFAPGCGNVFSGGGSSDPAPYVDPFTFSGSYGPGHLVGCGGNISTTPITGGFTVHT